MKNLNYYSILIGICSLLFFGCDTHKEEKDAYIGTWRYTFRENLTWDEITYEEANPKNYILTQYQLVGDTLSNNEVQLYLHKDGERIGAIDVTLDGKVYFSNESNTNCLLYDFGKMDKKFDGYYERYLNYLPTFYNKNKMNWGDIDDIDVWRFYSHWCEDEKEGYIINGLGSTSGFLSKVESPIPNGYKHLVLQIYYLEEINNCYTDFCLVYYTLMNRDKSQTLNPIVLKLNLPFSFWRECE